MNLYWTSNDNYWHLHKDENRLVGFIERLLPNRFNACDMSNMKWVWKDFDNLDDAKAWSVVCARMNQ